MSNGTFYRYLQRFGIHNPNAKRIKKTRKFQLDERITLRKQGKSIGEIAKAQGVSQVAIYYSLMKHVPHLVSKRKSAKQVNLKSLIDLREKKFCISAQAHKTRFYVYARKRWKRENIQKYLGIISRNLLVQLFHPKEIEAFSRNFSLNHVLDCIIFIFSTDSKDNIHSNHSCDPSNHILE